MQIVEVGTPVRVYWNFHKKLFSVQAKVDGRWKVVEHSNLIVLQDVTFKVNQAGRERVLKEKKKNVHAKIHGVVTTMDAMVSFKGLVKYNPYLSNNFIVTYNNHTTLINKANVVKLASIMGGPRVAVMA